MAGPSSVAPAPTRPSNRSAGSTAVVLDALAKRKSHNVTRRPLSDGRVTMPETLL